MASGIYKRNIEELMKKSRHGKERFLWRFLCESRWNHYGVSMEFLWNRY